MNRNKNLKLKDERKRRLQCNKCFDFFYCYSSSSLNCWCFEMPSVKINENLKDCLCKNCLDK